MAPLLRMDKMRVKANLNDNQYRPLAAERQPLPTRTQ
jgi:hypothetical protein